MEKKALVLPEATNLNQHAIKLQKGQQSFYRLIYSLGLVEFEILKIYIKTNLTNSFIWRSKLPTSTFIFFVRKPDSTFCLYMDYWGLNNLTIKNQYALSFIDELLN